MKQIRKTHVRNSRQDTEVKRAISDVVYPDGMELINITLNEEVLKS